MYFPYLVSSLMNQLCARCLQSKAEHALCPKIADILGETPNIRQRRAGEGCVVLSVTHDDSSGKGASQSALTLHWTVLVHVQISEDLVCKKTEDKCLILFNKGNPDHRDSCHPCNTAAACEYWCNACVHIAKQCSRAVLFCLYSVKLCSK